MRARIHHCAQAAAITVLTIGWLAGSAAAQSRHAVIAVDGNSGRTLHAEAADAPRYPASLTKMMTIYLAFELIEAGRLSYTTRIKMSQEAASQAPSKLDLEPGEELTLLDAIKALVTKSANDVAVAVAEHIAGSETEFAKRMTAKARQLGMASTTFRNASGLPNPGQVTTARDMVALAIRLHDDFPRHYRLFSLRAFQFNGSTYRNHNTLLGTYEGVEGLKTGYTRVSGFNLVTSVKRGNRHVFAAVFGGDTAGSRNATMRALLNRTLLLASPLPTRKPAPATAMLVATARPAVKIRPHPAPSAAPVRPPVPAPAPVATTAPASPTVLAAAPPKVRAPEPTPRPGVVAPQPAGTPATTVEAAAQSGDASAASVRFAMARIRPVMVAPRQRQPDLTTGRDGVAPPSTPAPATSDPATQRMRQFAATAPLTSLARAPSTLDSQASSLAADDPRTTTVIDKSSARAPLSPAATLAPVAAIAAEPALVRSTASTLEQPQRGQPPSTLAAQAAALAGPVPAAPAVRVAGLPPPRPQTLSRLNGPSQSATTGGPATPAAAAGQFHLQIGAYATAQEAERALGATRQRAPALLAAHAPLTMPVAKENRQLFRARFIGFSAQAAASTCLELRRQQIDCFVMKGE